MISFFNLIRWKNLLLIALAQLLIKYSLLEPLKDSYNFDTALKPVGVLVLVISTLCIAAAGYIINDIEDVKADSINKPNKVIIGKAISEDLAMKLFIGLNSIGVVLGFFLAQQLEKKAFVFLFILTAVLLYWYSIRLKKIAFVGNIVVACLIGFSILMVGIFDLIPVRTASNLEEQVFFLRLILDYAVFAFMINLIRELVKDIEDIDGDYNAKSKSLPIILGRNRASKVTFSLSLIPLVLLIFYTSTNLYKQPVAIAYALLCLVAPLIYIAMKLYTAEIKKDYSHISDVLKLVMLMGVLSLVLFQFIL